MTDQEKIILLRDALKTVLHRLEVSQKVIRSSGNNNNPNVSAMVKAYSALRETQNYYDPVQPAPR